MFTLNFEIHHKTFQTVGNTTSILYIVVEIHFPKTVEYRDK